MTAIYILVIFAFGIWGVAFRPRRACSVRGRDCAGRMAGGTIDYPICVECLGDRGRPA